MLVDQVFLSWVGPISIGVERNGVIKAFSLEEGQAIPPEFKVGDLVELHLEGDPMVSQSCQACHFSQLSRSASARSTRNTSRAKDKTSS